MLILLKTRVLHPIFLGCVEKERKQNNLQANTFLAHVWGQLTMLRCWQDIGINPHHHAQVAACCSNQIASAHATLQHTRA